MNYPVPGGMLEPAENLRREYAIARDEQDELAYESHQRAVAAQQRLETLCNGGEQGIIAIFERIV